jgi:hypothetical protein
MAPFAFLAVVVLSLLSFLANVLLFPKWAQIFT